jgi:hypothetical protein
LAAGRCSIGFGERRLRRQTRDMVENLGSSTYLRAWAIAFCLTVVIETPIVTWLCRRAEPRVSRRILMALAANALSHPAVWFVFPALGLAQGATTALSEIWAWLIEAALYRVGLGNTTWRAVLGISLVANLLSFGLGLVLWALGALP